MLNQRNRFPQVVARKLQNRRIGDCSFPRQLLPALARGKRSIPGERVRLVVRLVVQLLRPL